VILLSGDRAGKFHYYQGLWKVNWSY